MTTNDDLNATVADQLKIPKLQSVSKQIKWQMTYSSDGWLSVQVHVAEGKTFQTFLAVNSNKAAMLMKIKSPQIKASVYTILYLLRLSSRLGTKSIHSTLGWNWTMTEYAKRERDFKLIPLVKSHHRVHFSMQIHKLHCNLQCQRLYFG